MIPSRYSSSLYGLSTAMSTLNLEWPTAFWYLYPAFSISAHTLFKMPWFVFACNSAYESCNFPFSANSRKSFSDSTPFAFVRFKSIISEVMMVNTIISDLARETATFRRFHPPSLFNGPKLSESFPSSSGPNATEKRITSLSSPCTFSRFFTNKASAPVVAHLSNSISFANSSWSISSISVCWLILNVTTPIDWFFNVSSLYLRLISFMMAFASPSLIRPFLRSKKPSAFTMLTLFSLSFTDGNVSMEFS